jgi:hypothetical protein
MIQLHVIQSLGNQILIFLSALSFEVPFAIKLSKYPDIFK